MTLTLRQEQAELLGYPNYAEVSLASKVGAMNMLWRRLKLACNQALQAWHLYTSAYGSHTCSALSWHRLFCCKELPVLMVG